MELDRIDRAILSTLQQDCSCTNLQLAEQVGLSPPACLKRVKRLTDEGYIDKKVALLVPEKFGPCLHMVVEVIMERDNKAMYQRFLNRAVAAPEVKQCYRVTGEVDFVLIVMVPDMDAYEAFCDRVLHADDNMKKFRTLISMKRDKFETAIEVRA
ncbi:Lrp/AsnC family transcriptional regulator [Pokkaliibacter plantistimulans]|uniref:Lrp/AsnC family transcriptional regulator n=1 Tax=Proteobacteria bacterium 228 TaxID=2083153 RepID=A0A2S5KVA6_9PROT|nr:Lrp/AsnC family transcriptional regulator [Pokkaliibacter plantistimulans]PPC78653.1 Lrp/AsnC family transcriptional regulator [Pokkaliibacter plantistimulans]